MAQQYFHPNGVDVLDGVHTRFLKTAARKMGQSISWQSLAARPQSPLTKHLIEACDNGDSPDIAVESYG